MAKKRPIIDTTNGNARQLMVRAAEAQGHRLDRWRDVADGVRGVCINEPCRGHMYLRWGEEDCVKESNPTVLQVSCPYRAVNLIPRNKKVFQM